LRTVLGGGTFHLAQSGDDDLQLRLGGIGPSSALVELSADRSVVRELRDGEGDYIRRIGRDRGRAD